MNRNLPATSSPIKSILRKVSGVFLPSFTRRILEKHLRLVCGVNIRRKTEVTLADYISVGLIVPHLRGHDVASVIQELSEALKLAGRVPDSLP